MHKDEGKGDSVMVFALYILNQSTVEKKQLILNLNQNSNQFFTVLNVKNHRQKKLKLSFNVIHPIQIVDYINTIFQFHHLLIQTLQRKPITQPLHLTKKFPNEKKVILREQHLKSALLISMHPHSFHLLLTCILQ